MQRKREVLFSEKEYQTFHCVQESEMDHRFSKIIYEDLERTSSAKSILQ